VLRYEQAVKNEYVKRKLGLATLIDVITVQDRLDGARLQLLQLRQEYSSGIAQILFDAGELVGRDGVVPGQYGTARPAPAGAGNR
jgi:outer membrane protein TolC